VDSDISGGIFPFGPTLAAIIMTALLLGRPGLRELWDRQIRRPPRRRWYAIVLAVPITYTLPAVAITLALGASAETDDPTVGAGSEPSRWGDLGHLAFTLPDQR
jgi:hypothetical protein